MPKLIDQFREAPCHIGRAMHFIRTLKHLTRHSTEYMHNNGVEVIKHEWHEAIEEIEKHLEALQSLVTALHGGKESQDGRESYTNTDTPCEHQKGG